MKKILLICYALLAVAFILPFFLRDVPQNAEKTELIITPSDKPADSASAAADSTGGKAKREGKATVRVKIGEECLDMDMTDYLTGVLAAEMPASFNGEALRAQAVAARTYTLYCAALNRHADAEVCTSPGCCQAWLGGDELQERLGANWEEGYAKLRSAVEDTAGEYLMYEGKAAFAAFHSSSAGSTEASGEVWNAVPYLVSVTTPEIEADVPGYVSTVTLTALDFRDTLLSLHPEADFTGAPETWIGSITRTPGGRVETATLGGVSFTGGELRQLFALRSTAFEVKYADGGFCFTVTGFGHGVGMSQYGANVMAGQGADYKEILAHYYPGTTLAST